ncbi:MAG: hypothetical protein LBD52_01585, partial [Prevotellaceae bacterium]|nr:hypothetical protein [Prevotellaceae bacterium]
MISKFFRKDNHCHQFKLTAMGLLLLCPVALSAQNGVTVAGLELGAGTVTFNVSWQKPMPVEVWSDSVWVWVDYNNEGKMKRLPLLPGATLTQTSAPGTGRIVQYDDNNKGVWVVGNARSAGSFSATVQLYTVTAIATGACAYASNYPPLGEYTTANSISFTGTPMYEITLETSGGSTYTAYSNGVFAIPGGADFVSFTDATGAPGTFHCIPPVAPEVKKGEFCYGQSGELVAVASGDVIIQWYDAAIDGNMLYAGSVFPLTPLYSNTAQYYAQAMSGENCRSMQVKAEYTVNKCTMGGDCPNYTAGNVGSNSTPAACAAHYAGQIGAAGGASSVCVAHEAGRISGGAVICDPPDPPASLEASTLTAYVGQVVTLTAGGGADGSGAQFEWGSGVPGTGQGVKTVGNTYQVSPATTTTYWVRRVSLVNCGEPTAAANVTI